jgi:hypothetical protein
MIKRIFLAIALLTAMPVAAEEPGEPDLELLAQKSNNPLSDVWLLITQNDTTLYKGDLLEGTKTVNSTKLQPVMPVPIFGGDWSTLGRRSAVLPDAARRRDARVELQGLLRADHPEPFQIDAAAQRGLSVLTGWSTP